MAYEKYEGAKICSHPVIKDHINISGICKVDMNSHRY